MVNITESMNRLKEKGYTVAEISRKTGMSKSTLYDLENGTTPKPRIETIDKLCSGLNISIDEFLYGNNYGKLLSILKEIMKLDEKSREYVITTLEATTKAMQQKRA